MGARLLMTQLCVTESTEVPVAAGGVLPDHVLHEPGPGKSPFTLLSCHHCLFLQASSLRSRWWETFVGAVHIWDSRKNSYLFYHQRVSDTFSASSFTLPRPPISWLTDLRSNQLSFWWLPNPRAHSPFQLESVYFPASHLSHAQQYSWSITVRCLGTLISRSSHKLLLLPSTWLYCIFVVSSNYYRHWYFECSDPELYKLIYIMDNISIHLENLYFR